MRLASSLLSTDAPVTLPELRHPWASHDGSFRWLRPLCLVCLTILPSLLPGREAERGRLWADTSHQRERGTFRHVRLRNY